MAQQIIQTAIQQAFPDFEVEEDLGFFGYDPARAKATDMKKVTAAEMRKCTDIHLKPDTLLPSANLQALGGRTTFPSLPPHNKPSTYPHEVPRCAPVLAALEKGYTLEQLEKVHFLFGGSGLHMLGERTIDASGGCRYIVQKIPLPGSEHSILQVGKHKVYTKDCNAVGFQFERMVTGQRSETDKLCEHLQVVKIGQFRVMCSADADAMEGAANASTTVEVKSGNPRYLFNDTKLLLQMTSSGAQKLVHADRRGPNLQNVLVKSYTDVARQQPARVRQEVSDKIIDGLAQLQALRPGMKSGVAYEIRLCAGDEVQVVPCPAVGSLLPPDEEILLMLQQGAAGGDDQSWGVRSASFSG